MHYWLEHEWTLPGWRCAGLLALLLLAFQMTIGHPSSKKPATSAANGFSTQELFLSFSRPQPPAAQAQLSKTPSPMPHSPRITESIAGHKPAVSQSTETQKIEEKITESKPAAAQQSQGVHQTTVITDPMFAQSPLPPRYPSIARRRGQQGTVWLEVWLDEQGSQTRLLLQQSSGIKALDSAALDAVENWRFLPHQVNGHAIASRVRIPVEFSLQ